MSFVAPAREVDQDGLVGAHGLGQLDVGHGVAGFQRRDDALGAAQAVEGVQRLASSVMPTYSRAAQLLQPGVLGADTG